MVPAGRRRGPLFHWTCRKCSSSRSIIVTTGAPENTRSSNDGDTVAAAAATEVSTAGHQLWKTFPTLSLCSRLSHSHSLSLAFALSDSVQRSLFLCSTSLALSLPSLESPNRPSCVACTLVTRRRCPAWVSAAPLRVVPHSFSPPPTLHLLQSLISKDCDTKLGDAFSRYEPLPRTNREFSLKAKSKLGLFPDDIQAD